MRSRLLPALLLLLAAPALAQAPASEPAPAPAAEPTPAPPQAPAAEPPAPPPAPQQAAVDPTPAPPATDPGPPPPPGEPPLGAPPPIPPPAPPAAAASTAAAAAALVPAPPSPPPTVEPYPKFGLRFGLGVPHGVTADLVVRPLPSLRLMAGPAWNYLSYGIQGGIALTPVRWYISPVLEASAGHFFHSNLSSLYKPKPGDRVDPTQLLEKVAYDYVSGHFNLEFGSPRGFTFSMGVGLTWFWMTLHGSATALPDPASTGQPWTVTMSNPTVRAVIPSLRLGFLFYF